MSEPILNQKDLAQFYGSETWYRHGLVRDILYTEGVHYVAEKGSAHWLINEIAFSQVMAVVAVERFQSWELLVHDDGSADLRCEDGNGNTVLSKEIEYTDFPFSIRFYFTDNVIMLTSEY